MSLRSAQLEVFGFPTFIHASILLLPASYAWALKQAGLPMWYLASFTLVLIASVLIHELGHAWALRWYGSQCQTITLHGLGGHVKWCEHCQSVMRPSWKFTVAVAGPLAGFAPGVLGLLAIPFAADQVTLMLVTQVAFVGIGFNVTNLLPVFPLDGGHAALALSQMILPRILHTVAATLLHLSGIAVGVGLAYYGYTMSDPFAGLYALAFIGINALAIFAAVFKPGQERAPT